MSQENEVQLCCIFPSGSLDLLECWLSLSPSFAKVFEIRITCYWISLLRKGSAVNYSHVQINRINFPKRFALAQQFLTISGSNLIAAVIVSLPPSSSTAGAQLLLIPEQPGQQGLAAVSRRGMALARQKWQTIPSFKSQPDRLWCIAALSLLAPYCNLSTKVKDLIISLILNPMDVNKALVLLLL